MSWNTLPPNIRATAERELTPGQLETFILEQAGLSTRQIADKLDLARTTVRDQLRAAHTNLRRAGVRSHPDGTLYLKETA